MFNMIIFGPPGSGKGTQSKIVASHYGFLHLSTGDLFRNEIANNSAIGDIVKKYMTRGLLIPDTIVMRELYRFAIQNQNSKGIVFDGFPRTIEQAISLDRVFVKKELNIKLVISMQVPNDILIQRIVERGKDSGRADDTEEVVMKRLEVYEQYTHPVIDYYKKSKRLVELDCNKEIEEVFDSIKKTIDETIKKDK